MQVNLSIGAVNRAVAFFHATQTRGRCRVDPKERPLGGVSDYKKSERPHYCGEARINLYSG